MMNLSLFDLCFNVIKLDSYIGVFLLVGGLVVGRGGISSGLVGLVVAVRLGSDGGNDGEENDGDL